jgi:hypothetical protein
VALGFVRPARPDDAGEIARIQLSTWRVAYDLLVPQLRLHVDLAAEAAD